MHTPVHIGGTGGVGEGVVGERVGMGALAVEFLLGCSEGGVVVGGLEAGAVVVALLPFVWCACHCGEVDVEVRVCVDSTGSVLR